jgi:serine/threonine protein kinase
VLGLSTVSAPRSVDFFADSASSITIVAQKFISCFGNYHQAVCNHLLMVKTGDRPLSSLTTSSEFMTIVHKSRVLDEKRFEELHPDESELPESPSDCAALFIKEGLLTSYQAKQLLSGKFKGFRLGPYKILQPLGKGGMGMVFLGEHLSLKRKVAIKVLPSDKAKDNLSFERFQREARAVAALDHPNIVRLHDISQGAGVHFLAMEYIEGTDLQSYLAQVGPLNFVQAAQYIAQTAAGLQHAHEKGFVHRDIKPANLMVTKEGTIKILDMGLARSYAREEDDLTGQLGEDAEIAGTVDYSSPEHVLGLLVDERSDIYSLGVTLFTLVVGHPPFRGSPTQKLAQHQMVTPPRLNKLKTVVPEALSDVVAKMMAKKPSERYQSMSDVIDALAPWLPAASTGNIVAEGISQTDLRGAQSTQQTRKRQTKRRSIKPKKQNQIVLIGGVVLGVLFVIGLFMFILGGKSDPIPESKTTVENQKEESKSPLPQSRFDVLEPIDVRGELQPIDLSSFVTASTLSVVQYDGKYNPTGTVLRIQLSSWGRKQIGGIPFDLIDPNPHPKLNVIALFSRQRPPHMELPRTVTVPIHMEASRLHFLGGVSGWGWPFRTQGDQMGVDRGVVSVIVRLRYEDDMVEEHEWKNGEELVDYNGNWGQSQVPRSKMAIVTEHNNQIRYLSITPQRQVKIKEIEFAKGPNDEFTVPLLFSLTVEKEPK